MSNDGWDQLSTVRLILASIVAVGHAVGIFGYPFGLISETGLALAGYAAEFAVLSFFLISGMVIGRSLIRRVNEGDRLFLAFFKARLLRIYPPLIASVVLTGAFALILRVLHLDHYTGPASNLMRDSFSYLDNWPDVWKALITFGFRGGLGGSSNGPLWSLALEMQAYVFVGLVAQIIVAGSWSVRIASAVLLALALRARGLHGLEIYHYICFGCFAVGVGLSFLPIRFPKVLPVVTLDFSYSLYILHFPIMLFIFFIACQGNQPSLVMASMLIVASLAITTLVSMASGVVFERRAWIKRTLPATAKT